MTITKPVAMTTVALDAVVSVRFGELRFCGCPRHKESLDLSCAGIRTNDGLRLTTAQIWEVLQEMQHANTTDAPNQQHQATDCTPRLEKLVATWRDMSDSEMRLRCGEMTAQEIRSVKAVLQQILPATEAPAHQHEKCRHCGSDEGAWFSRTVPMGYFCEICGKPWTESDGVDMTQSDEEKLQ